MDPTMPTESQHAAHTQTLFLLTHQRMTQVGPNALQGPLGVAQKLTNRRGKG